jgi:hypothetical protein
MRELRASDPHCLRWIMVPESAPLAFDVGVDSRSKQFQLLVVRMQIALERVCDEFAHFGQVLICHRGTLDPLAYWLREGWAEEEFIAFTGMGWDQHLERYFAAFHLETSALGAESHYRCWPNDRRRESATEATEIDTLCGEVWRRHSRYERFKCCSEWDDKSLSVRRRMQQEIDKQEKKE